MLKLSKKILYLQEINIWWFLLVFKKSNVIEEGHIMIILETLNENEDSDHIQYIVLYQILK